LREAEQLSEPSSTATPHATCTQERETGS
jgi:hypothetical protein